LTYPHLQIGSRPIIKRTKAASATKPIAMAKWRAVTRGIGGSTHPPVVMPGLIRASIPKRSSGR
jgi:hypothetical protein